jgi:penicillin-binding protein 1B
LLLGAVDLTPWEVAQMYETFASGGFRIPLRAIREVTTAEGEPLQRYPLNVEKAIEPGPTYLLTRAMQRVVQSGTARAMSEKLSASLGIAGKTGTTDDLRDSWFAGFSGNLLSVVWLGRDDNTPAGMSGSSGALRIWMDTMRELHLEPLNLSPPPGIELALVDPQTGLRADGNCPNAQIMPFLNGSAPQHPAPCSAEFFYSRTPEPYYNTERPRSRSEPGNHNGSESDPIRSLFKRLME